jgi:glyoxylase-like metal-dependent hydrolase (beta-lactamase superfamily II)
MADRSRAWVLAALLLPLTTAAGPPPSAAATPVSTPSSGTASVGVFAWKLGRFKIVALSDGSGKVPFDRLLHGMPPEQIRAAYAKAGVPLPAPNSYNAFLIDTGAHKLLVDTGNGDKGPDVGHLRANLLAAGYKPEQIDLILITHFHGDHIGGLTANGKAVFPNATVRADRHETDYWLSPAGEAAAKSDDKARFTVARAAFAPYQAMGRLKPFDSPTQIVPGVRSVPDYGHTPGHSAYLVQSEGKTLLLLGDTLHAAPVQFAAPTVTIAWDWDEAKARAARLKVFAAAAKGGWWIAGAHLPFPGTGHIKAQGDGYVFTPVKTEGPQ